MKQFFADVVDGFLIVFGHVHPVIAVCLFVFGVIAGIFITAMFPNFFFCFENEEGSQDHGNSENEGHTDDGL